MKNRFLPPCIVLFHICVLFTAAAQPQVQNPGFEADGHEIREVGYTGQENPISHWRPDDVWGVGRNTAGGPFADNGRIPEGANAAFIQNRHQLSQTIEGFETGKSYRVSLRATARMADAPEFGEMEVSLNETTIIGPVQLQPAESDGVWKEYSVLVTTGGGALDLTIAQAHRENGKSIVFDDVRIEETDVAPTSDEVLAIGREKRMVVADPLPEATLKDLHWIWHPEDGDTTDKAPVAKRFFRRTFEVPDVPVERAFFIGLADNEMNLYVNGTRAASIDDWATAFRASVIDLLRDGTNVLAIEAENTDEAPNPAGILGKLCITFKNGDAPLVIALNKNWKVSKQPEANWKQLAFNADHWPNANEVAPLGTSPWGMPNLAIERIPDAFPSFVIPGHEEEMTWLQDIFYEHWARAPMVATMWDMWLPMSIVWPVDASTKTTNVKHTPIRHHLLTRHISEEGYVSTYQHVGVAHSEGWPFPTWQQARGAGWHFTKQGMPLLVPVLDSHEGWTIQGIRDFGVQEEGWVFEVTDDQATLTAPEWVVDSFISPFVRIDWKFEGAPEAMGSISWNTPELPEFDDTRRAVFDANAILQGRFINIPLYEHPAYGGSFRQFRITLENAKGARVTLRAFHTACDTRHSPNGPNWLQGSTEYLRWTGDIAFLRDNITRMRKVLGYTMEEFDTLESKCIDMPWVGHDGRSGLEITPEGDKIIHYGRGIGNNYWDLLPFSGRDGLATQYYYDALIRMADVEAAIEAHPEWNVPDTPNRIEPDTLRDHAAEVREHYQDFFWNDKTGRFVAAVDIDEVKHDYGYTFVNFEAIYYGLASDEQAREICDWISGKRMVPGDTSQGEDIYRWRFAPRASTLRNVEYYVWSWSAPETTPWGYQVQDGGAVLGFSYHDLMSRLKVYGPDDTWKRLSAIIDWYEEVMKGGGVRAWYGADRTRGSLQGGGTAGGLGIDSEFFESVLVAQVMLYGFLGVEPDLEALTIAPQLPEAFPSLEVTRVGYHGNHLNLHADQDGTIRVTHRAGPADQARVRMRPGAWQAGYVPTADDTPETWEDVSDTASSKGVALKPAMTLVLRPME